MSQVLRVVTYNVRYFAHALRGIASTRRSVTRIAAGLAALSPAPDLICLQEIESRTVRGRGAYGKSRAAGSQLELLVSELERATAGLGHPQRYQGFYFAAHQAKVGDVRLTSSGLAILVREGRLHVEGHNVHKPEHITHRALRWKQARQTRICAELRVLTPAGKRLHVFNTHFSLPSPFVRAFWERKERMGWGANQLVQARRLATFIEERVGQEPFLVCGDFNSPPSSPVYRFLTEEAGLVGAQETLGQIDPTDRRGFPTAGFLRLRMHLDHLFSGNGVTWVDLAGTLPFGERASPFRGLSDHVPLLAAFKC